MTDEGERHSKAEDATLITDPELIAIREAENAIAQFDRVLDLIDDVQRGGRPFRLRTSMILDLHRLALDGLSPYAGNFRPSTIEIGQSKHVPPPEHLVPSFIDEMCDYIMDQFASASAIHLCAYVMWRLNWIHPFTDGNGRTSRALSYFVLCAKIGYRLPGHTTIPEQIASDKPPYYDALEKADEHFAEGRIDLGELEELLQQCLATQLLSAYQDASNPEASPEKQPKLH